MKNANKGLYIIFIFFVFSCSPNPDSLNLQNNELIKHDGKLKDISGYSNIQSIKFGFGKFCLPLSSVKDFDLALLTEIDLGGSNIGHSNCDCFEGFNYLISGRKVEQIVLRGNLISYPDCIRLIHPISRIDLSVNNIRDWDTVLVWINNGMVKDLDLGVNRLNFIPDKFKINTTLTNLDLSNNIIFQVPPSVKNLKALHELSLTNNFLDSLPAEIAELKNLKKIYLSNNRFKVFPEVLLTMPHLENIDIAGNKFPIINDSIYAIIKQRLPNTKIYYETRK